MAVGSKVTAYRNEATVHKMYYLISSKANFTLSFK